MKTFEKITAFLALAGAMALQAGPAFAGDSSMQQLPGPNALSLVALGVVAAVYIARRFK